MIEKIVMYLKQIREQITNLEIVKLIQASVDHWQDANVSQLAAALAYHTIFSLAPLLIIAIYVAGLLLGRADVEDYVTTQIQTMMGEEGTQLILSMIRNLRQDNSGMIASIIGLSTVIFGASRVFNQLEVTLNIIFTADDQADSGIKKVLRKRGLSFLMMIGVSILLLISILFSTSLSLINNLFDGVIPQAETLVQVLNYLLPIVIGTFMFSAMYKFIPNRDMTWRNTLAGGFLTAVLFSIGQFLISYYLGNSSIASAYGAAGSLLMLLVWIYYSAQIFYFGAIFTKVYADRKKLLSEEP